MLVIVVGVLAFCGWLVYSRLKTSEKTREHYALKCLAAISALVMLAVASISSKQGVLDKALAVIYRLMNYPVPQPIPAPLSEKMLIAVVVMIAVWLIYKSHANWPGLISADESDRRRMKLSNSVVQQAMSEGVRIAARRPVRKIYAGEQRVDPVAMPEEQNLVMHDNMRELFELWMPSAVFSGGNMHGWDPRTRSWLGREKIRNNDVLLYCVHERPEVSTISDLLEGRSSSAGVHYVVYRGGGAGEVSEKYIVNINGRSVNVLSEEYLYNNIVDFSDYFSEIARRVEDEKFPNTELSIGNIYTASSISADAAGKKIVSKDLGGYLSEWANRPAGKHIAILGEYGQGKSTSALMFVYESCRTDRVSSGGRVPILIELRGKSPANLSPLELLAAWAQQYRLHASAVMKLLIAGKLVLIFEGFDEMANVSSVESRVSHFRALWRFAYPSNKIIFTGRRNLFFEDNELQVVFKGAFDGGVSSICEVVNLCPFNFEQIEDSLRWVDRSASLEIISVANRDHHVYDIVARPALLFIVASLWEELRPLFREGGVTSSQVIDRFVSHSYERQQLKERELGFMALTTTERRYFHEGIAVYMASREQTNQITSQDLIAAVERLYREYPADCNISDSVVAETSRPSLKARMPVKEEAIEAIVTDVRTHGILVNDVGRKGAYRFAHKSFYELLAAKVQACNILDIEPMFYRSIVAAVDDTFANPVRSPEMLVFYSEIIMSSLKKSASSEDLAVQAFDLIVGVKTPSLRAIPAIRNFQLLALRFLYNSRLKKILYFSFFALMPISLLLKLDFFQDFFTAHSELSFLVTPKVEAIELSGLAALLGAVIVLGLISLMLVTTAWYTVWYERSKLWAAVLISTDTTNHIEAGKSALKRMLGGRAANDIINKVYDRYGAGVCND